MGGIMEQSYCGYYIKGVLCFGKIKDIIMEENGKFVIDRICERCGKNHGLNEISLPHDSGQMILFPMPAQYRLF